MRVPALLLLAAALPAQAQIDDDDAPLRFLVGLRLENAPVYFGQIERDFKPHPVLALRWGRIRFSNSGGSALLGERGSSGASADLLQGTQWRANLGLRIDRGRSLDKVERLHELPDVRSTLRLRLSVGYRPVPGRDFSLSVNTDLLGRNGGQQLQLGWTELLPSWDALSPIGGHWQVFTGIGGGSHRYMNSYFGVPAGTRYTTYEPGAGLRDAWLGLGWKRELSPSWVLTGGGAVSRLLGPARRAPFIERANAWAVDVGLAYRY